MFRGFLQWGVGMAEKLKETAKGRLRDLPRVRLIPVVDSLSDGVQRRNEVQAMLATMFASLHQRGRPRKDGGENKDHAA
jgi:hypothetical protein